MNSVMKAWSDCPPIFADRLMALLSDAGRLYHNLHRTNALLLEADRTCDPHWLRPLRWALLYHDAVHPLDDPGADAPDARTAAGSTELWLEHFPALHETIHGVSGQWEQDVATAIQHTADPFVRPDRLLPWQQALLDLTCGPLGAAPAVYDAHRLLMMAEALQAGMTRERWSSRRRQALARASACPVLFHVVHRDREPVARDNLRRELASL